MAVIVLATTGFALGGVAWAPSTAGARAPTATAAPTVAGLNDASLTEVSGPSLSAQTVAEAGQYGYTISPDPSAFNAAQKMTLQVSVGSSQGLDNFVQDIQNPTSPLFHDFVSSSTLAGAFGVSASQYAADSSYFTGYGLTVTPDPDRIYLTVSGTIDQVDAAFHTQIGAFSEQYYSPGAWNPLFGNASAGLNSTTTRIVYLSTGNAYLPSGMAANSVAGLSTLFGQPDISTPFAGESPATNLTQLGITTTTPTPTWYYSPTQVLGGGTDSACATNDFTWAYLDGLAWQFLFPCSMPALTGATNLQDGASTIDSEPDQGQGVTIGIIDVGCPIPSDLQAYDQQTGVDLLNHLTVIALNTTFEATPNTNLDGCVYNGEYWGWTSETELDLEYASAMAPEAHIDLISVGDPSLTTFDAAYQFTADYLTSGAPTALPAASGSTVLSLVTGATSQTTSAADSSVTITSNSYGTGEQLSSIFGTPMYLTVENEALDELAAAGVTNLFASGDSGPTVYPFPVQAGIPADASGVTSVGGGMVTAEYNGEAFPNTGIGVDIGGEWMTAAPVSGVASYTYWQESDVIQYQYESGYVNVPALPPGETGGGFGQSFSQAQPWWQNALDMYDSGALIDPVVSGSAAFNMSIYTFGGWALTYGGTSFATPIFAGEWALIEEQALTAFGTARMGDINALLFDVHNAQQAGVIATDAYVPMTNIGTGGVSELLCTEEACGVTILELIGLWGPTNGYGQYLLASQDEFPQDQNLPSWFGTLDNPAGSGWNYLQGLGMPLADLLDSAIIGEDPGTQHALADEPFYVEEVDGSSVVPVQTLVAGQTYTLQIVSAGGSALVGPFDVTTYSDGVTSTTQIDSATFTYTPGWASQLAFSNGTEYGYFYVSVATGGFSPSWTFQYFAVAQPLLDCGTLTLGVFTPLGVVTNGEAQVPMEQSTALGTVASGGEAIVTLNGVPVGGAQVTQTALEVSPAAIADPTIPSTPDGTTIGTYLSSVSGLAAFWTDSGQLYADIVDQAPGTVGPLLPVVFTLQATYDGLTSNPVTVVAEPESGYFSTNVTLSGGYVTGTVGFYGMTYLNYLNLSVGSSPGEYVNYTYTPQTVYTGQISVDLLAPSSGPVVLSAVAAGVADYMVIACGGLVGYGDYFAVCGLEEPLNYSAVWQDPVVMLPASLSASQSTLTVAGDDTFTWSGTAFTGATGTLSLVSAAGSTVLATGLSGSYVLDTATLLDGYYSVVFTERAPGAITTTRTVSVYADNEAVSLSALVGELQGQLSTDQQTIASLDASVAALQSGWASANATIASDQTEINSLDGLIATLQTELASAQAEVSTLQTEVASLQAQGGADAAQISALQGELATAQTTISTDQTQIQSLQATVAQLQAELNAKKGVAPTPWYDALPGGGLGLMLISGIAGALIAGLAVALVGRRRPQGPGIGPVDGSSSANPPPGAASELTARTPSVGPGVRSPEEILRRARLAQSRLLAEGNLAGAAQLQEAADRLAGLRGLPQERSVPQSLYR